MRAAPRDAGSLELIAVRPAPRLREVVDAGVLDLQQGMIGDVLEVTPEPHLGCGKYIRRFGVEAMKLANTVEGRELRLRGMHARVIEPATVRRGDPVHRLG